MKEKNMSRFRVDDRVVLTNSVHGLTENLIVCVSNAVKNSRGEIEIDINGTHVRVSTKYLAFPKPNRYSSKFNNGDSAIVKRHYGRFTGGSVVTVESNYLGTNNKLVVKDDRGIIDGVPEPLLTKIAPVPAAA